MRRYRALAEDTHCGLQDIVKLAAGICNTPIALLTLVGEQTAMICCAHGIERTSVSRDISFCGKVVDGNHPLVVPDTHLDPRFKDNPLVIGPPHVRSYLGCPLRSPDDYPIGSICVIGHHPHAFTDEQQDMLALLGRQVMTMLNAELSKELFIKSEMRYKRLYEAMTDPFGETNLAGMIVNANPAFCNLVGYSLEELRGKSFYDITPERWHDFETAVVETQLMPRGDTDVYEKEYIHKNGSVFPVELKAFLLRDDRGIPTGILANVRDISERKAAEAALKQSEEQLNEAQRIAKTGSGILDHPSQRLTWSKEFYSITEQDPATYEATYDSFLALIHPEDQESIDAHFKATVLNREPFQYRCRLLLPNNRVKWIDAQCITEYAEDGTPLRSAGNIQDVTDQKHLQDQLLQSELRLQEAIRVSQIGIFDHNHETKSIYWSPELHRIFGWPSSIPVELEDFLKFVHPDDRERVKALGAKAHDPDSDGFYNIDHRIILPDGQVRWISSTSRTFFSGEGAERRPVRTVGADIDITETKEAERLLLESQTYLRTVIESEPACVKVISPTWILLDMNQSGLQMVEAESLEQVQGLNAFDLIDPKYHDAFRKTMSEIMEGKQSIIEFELIGLKGGRRWIEQHAVPLRESGNSSAIKGILAVSRDVTEHRLAQIALSESEERLRLALAAGRQGLYDLNVQTGEAFFSDEYAVMLGYDPETFVETNASWQERLHPDEREKVAKFYSDYIEGREPEYKLEFRQRTRTGDWKWILSTGKIVEWDHEGKPLRMIGTHLDITKQKLAEQALADSELRYRNLFAEAPVGHALNRLSDGKFIEINESFAQITGYTVDELNQLTYWDLTPEKYAQQELEQIEMLHTTGRYGPYEKHYIRKSGELVPVRLNGTLVYGLTDEPMILSVVEDITDRRIAEAALRESEERYRGVVTSLAEAVMLFDMQGNIIACNHSAELITGMTSEELLGNNSADTAWTLYHEDGSSLKFEEAPVARTMATGEPVRGFVMAMRRREAPTIWISANSQPLLGTEEGEIRGVVCTFTDITLRRQAEQELKVLNERLELRVAERTAQLDEKNKDLELFSYAVSHDLRSPLRAISGYSNLLCDGYFTSLDEEGQRLLERLEINASRLTQMLDGILSYSRIGKGGSTAMTVHMRECMESIVAVIQSESPNDAVEFEWDVDEISIKADRNALELCLRNLIQNAVKFSSAVEAPKVKLAAHLENDRCVIRITDNGVGFDMTYADKIFQMFSRLDNSTTGMGVGLALVDRAASRLGGNVRAESAEGKGSTFTLEIPAS